MIPTQRRQPGVSLRKIAPIITKNGISSCIIKAVAEASRPESPVNVRLYCKVADMKEISSNIRICPPLGLINQTKAKAVTLKRKAISKIGGKCAIAAFANTSPIPQTIATPSPRAISIKRAFIGQCNLGVFRFRAITGASISRFYAKAASRAISTISPKLRSRSAEGRASWVTR